MTGAPATAPQRSRQPWLHDLEVAVHGPVTCLSHRSGDVDARYAARVRRPACSSTTGGCSTGSP